MTNVTFLLAGTGIMVNILTYANMLILFPERRTTCTKAQLYGAASDQKHLNSQTVILHVVIVDIFRVLFPPHYTGLFMMCVRVRGRCHAACLVNCDACEESWLF